MKLSYCFFSSLINAFDEKTIAPIAKTIAKSTNTKLLYAKE
jgi:hypothetical protein